MAVKQFEKEEMVLQSYSYTMARHRLSAVEMRIMAHVLLQLKNEQISDYEGEYQQAKQHKVVKIITADVVVSENHGYVKSALTTLRKRDIEIETVTKSGKPAVVYTGLILRGEHSKDGSEIEIEIDKAFLPELVKIGRNYTKFGLEFLFKTSSSHAIRWYQLGSHWLNAKVFYISKDELKKVFDVEDKYHAHKDFMKYVIKDPLKIVNRESNLEISIVEQHKRGRKVSGFTISVKDKIGNENKPVKTRDSDTIDWINNATDNERKITRPLHKSQAEKFAGQITRYCNKEGKGTAEEITLGGTLPSSLNSWYDAISRIQEELQQEQAYKKYIPILRRLGYREL